MIFLFTLLFSLGNKCSSPSGQYFDLYGSMLELQSKFRQGKKQQIQACVRHKSSKNWSEKNTKISYLFTVLLTRNSNFVDLMATFSNRWSRSGGDCVFLVPSQHTIYFQETKLQSKVVRDVNTRRRPKHSFQWILATVFYLMLRKTWPSRRIAIGVSGADTSLILSASCRDTARTLPGYWTLVGYGSDTVSKLPGHC